ncbi:MULTISPECIES: hypothetical protein [unclassified Microcoleus]|uniref:hypothetical protein n=1 Tax=unclassified Microcoleus TaxID=2642155 RepID=UPI002FCF4576
MVTRPSQVTSASLVFGSVNICASPPESPEFLRGKQQAKIEAIAHLQAIGLSDEQIAECLDMTLEEIRQVDLTEENISSR